MRWLPRLYPAAWRRRYGEEFAALLEDRPLGPRQMPDIARGALDARIHPRVGDRYSMDGRLFIQCTGPLTRWTHTAVYADRTFAGTLMFPMPHQGLYYWKVEVPSVRGCAWRIDYNGS